MYELSENLLHLRFMVGRWLIVGLSLKLIAIPVVSFALPNPEPLAVAAEYYYTRHDYRQALRLWTEVFHRNPESTSAMLRVAELKLFYEGRAASKETVLNFFDTAKALDSATRRELQSRLGVLQSLFLSDDAQSSFLQAKTKILHKDWNGALVLLNQALNVEKGNLAILKEKAKSERALAQYEKSYSTLKLALDADPFDGEVFESLIEAQYFFKDYKELMALYLKSSTESASVKARTSYGLALLDSGSDTEAMTVFSGIIAQSNLSTVSPAVWYGMGKLLLKRDANSVVGTQYIERFVGLMGRPDAGVLEGWDSYRCAEKAEEATQWLAKWREARKAKLDS